MRQMLMSLLTVTYLTACSHNLLRYEFYREEIKFLHEQGNRYYQSGEYEKAAQSYRAITRIYPDYAEAYASLGNVWLAQGEAENAHDNYKKAISIKPALKNELESRNAYSQTSPQVNDAHSYEKFVKSVNALAKNDITQFKRYAETLKGPFVWADEQRKLFRSSTDQVSDLLMTRYWSGEFDDCKKCLLLSAAWFSPVINDEASKLIKDAMNRSLNSNNSEEMAYRLGLYYEKQGNRQAALSMYLRYPENTNIKSRLSSALR